MSDNHPIDDVEAMRALVREARIQSYDAIKLVLENGYGADADHALKLIKIADACEAFAGRAHYKQHEF